MDKWIRRIRSGADGREREVNLSFIELEVRKREVNLFFIGLVVWIVYWIQSIQVYFTLYTVHFTWYTAHRTLHTAHCALLTVQCTGFDYLFFLIVKKSVLLIFE